MHDSERTRTPAILMPICQRKKRFRESRFPRHQAEQTHPIRSEVRRKQGCHQNNGGFKAYPMTTRRTALGTLVSTLLVLALVSAQTVYQPKFKGDPARSDSEAAALGYLRTFLRAQRMYKKNNGHYATTLLELVHTGSFTRRMVDTDRGDYTVEFHPHKDKDTFEITLIPKQRDSTHRSFFSDQEGTIRADEEKDANESSPVLKAD